MEAKGEMKFEKGSRLFSEGELSQDLYIVQTGVIKIFKTVDGSELPLALVKPGQFIGELSFFDGMPRSATAEAAVDSKVLKIAKEDMDQVMKSLPSWMLTMIRSIAIRVRHADELVKRNKIVDTEVKTEFDQYQK